MALPDSVLYVIVILTSDNTRVYYLGQPIPYQRRLARSFIFVITHPHTEGIKHDRERNPMSQHFSFLQNNMSEAFFFELGCVIVIATDEMVRRPCLKPGV